MARTRTLAEMRTEARRAADMENSGFVADAEVTRQINQSIADLYDMLVEARGEEYYRTSTTLSTVAGTATVALPSDFYKSLGYDVTIAGDDKTIQPMEWSRRNDFEDSSGWAYSGRIFYQEEGASVRFWPTPGAVHTVTLWYIPHATELANDGDTFDGINGWERYVIYDTAIWLRNKEDSPTDGLLIERDRVEQRITRMAKERSMQGPPRTANTRRPNWLRGKTSDGWDAL